MPPATIAVLKALWPGKPMTAIDLKSETGYSIRTIRYSLKSLYKQRLVKKQINLSDMRVTEYIISVMTSGPSQEESRHTRIETEKLKSSVVRKVTDVR